jgi:carbonic anhydrase/acetyltransferase-like protein (isoleucine patch superfamily)
LTLYNKKKFSVGYRAIIEDYCIHNGMGDIIIGDYSSITSRVKLVGPVTIGITSLQ